MPNIFRVMISDLDPIRGMRSRCRQIMHGSQRLDGHGFLFETVCAMHAKMHLSVPRDHLFKQCQPIDIPTSEDRARILCDGEQDSRAIFARYANSIGNIVSLVGDNLHYGVPGNSESAAGLQSL